MVAARALTLVETALMGSTPAPRRPLPVGPVVKIEYGGKNLPEYGKRHEYGFIRSTNVPPDRIDYGDIWQGTPEIDRRLRVILGDEPDEPDWPKLHLPPIPPPRFMGHATRAVIHKLAAPRVTHLRYPVTGPSWLDERPSAPLRLLRE